MSNGYLARRQYLALLAAAVLFIAASQQLKGLSRTSALIEMQVALPRAVQVAFAFGDRFLAANLAGFRALVASTETMTQDNYRIQARVQSDAAWFNPAHEDNYYIAAAILPWNGEVAAAQYVLARAADARPFDWQPAFYFAFNALTFDKAPGVAAEWLSRAADAAQDEMQALQLKQLASQWVVRADDPALAIRLHRAMAKESQYSGFAHFLERRALRLENVWRLEQAVARYQSQEGRLPLHLEALVLAGLITAVPDDPFGAVYVLSTEGKVYPRQRIAAQERNLP